MSQLPTHLETKSRTKNTDIVSMTLSNVHDNIEKRTSSCHCPYPRQKCMSNQIRKGHVHQTTLAHQITIQ